MLGGRANVRGSTLIGAFNCLVIDYPEPRALAPFYEHLMGLGRDQDSENSGDAGGRRAAPRVAFQQVADFVPPD